MKPPGGWTLYSGRVQRHGGWCPPERRCEGPGRGEDCKECCTAVRGEPSAWLFAQQLGIDIDVSATKSHQKAFTIKSPRNMEEESLADID